MYEYLKFEILKGKTMVSVERVDDVVIFVTDNSETYNLFHEQDCCESVNIEDICGDLEDLVGLPLLLAEEVSCETKEEAQKQVPVEEQVFKSMKGEEDSEIFDDSQTWTFYKLSTVKGNVTIRFFSQSNGYYSESVDLIRVN